MPQPDAKSIVSQKIAGYLQDNLGFLLASISSVLLAVVAIVGLHDAINLLFTSIIGRAVLVLGAAAIVGYLLQVRQQKSRATLVHELRESRQQERAAKQRLAGRHAAAAACFREHLAAMAKAISFEATERVSVYKHRPDGRFRIVGRFSDNGTFNNVHRELHEPNEGVVSVAFLSVRRVDYDITHDPAGDYSAYKKDQFERFKVPGEVIDGLVMRSVSYSAFPIKDKNATKCIGVLVCESTVARRMTGLDYTHKILRGVEQHLDSLRLFVEAADEMDDYLLQSQTRHLANRLSVLPEEHRA